ENEIRVILIDNRPLVIYSKDGPSIIGDGKHSLLELALAAVPAELRSTVLSALARDFGRSALDEIPRAGQRCFLNWRHNLDSGARPILLEQGEVRGACVEMAPEAAQAIGTRCGSIDVVQAEGSWRLLDIKSGVMMEALARQ